jgi:hypothetical protein
MPHSVQQWVLAVCLQVVLFATLAHGAPPFGSQAVPRDAFPVFDNPSMLTVEVAERQGAVFAKDSVIGVQHGAEAKAYPITVMGVHELGNDMIDGIPIAISW